MAIVQLCVLMQTHEEQCMDKQNQQIIFLLSVFYTQYNHVKLWTEDVRIGGNMMVFSLVPRLSRNANMYRVESPVSFVRKHDVIKIRTATFARCSTNYTSTLGVYDIRRPVARYM